ncbi:hypothetical protein [Streptomyces sp. UH6]|uniref:hypothetical protein n=1 Tax=Streptomyces sp. UH6 TaxID=2748379 RepID=UPI0015D4A931|nr:hypothetical protein [Streptomyces sp. UH6]NYV73183.1 hypothetical protein [Streptomyces sp. UH6]
MTVPVPDVLPHVDAVMEALAAGGLTAYLGGAPASTPTQYCVVYPDPGRASSSSLSGRPTDLAAVVQMTCIGTTAERALWVAGRVRRALAQPLTVDGRRSWRPEDLGGPPVARDDDVTPPLWFVPVQYRLHSIPA